MENFISCCTCTWILNELANSCVFNTRVFDDLARVEK